MIWISAEKLDAAIAAMKDLCASTRIAGENIRIRHPTQLFSKAKWETVICGLIAANGSMPDGVYPERTYLISGLGSGAEKQWPPSN